MSGQSNMYGEKKFSEVPWFLGSAHGGRMWNARSDQDHPIWNAFQSHPILTGPSDISGPELFLCGLCVLFFLAQHIHRP